MFIQIDRSNKGSLLHFLAILLLSIWVLATPQTVKSQDNKPLNVLVLHSYHKGFSWTDGVTKGIERVFSKKHPDAILYQEYMDTKRFQTDEILQLSHHNLKQKYAQIDIDLIIVSDNAALMLMNVYRKELFGDIPLVFCGINNFQEINLEGNTQVTGVVEDYDIKGSLDLMLNLFPKTKTIYMINDKTLTGNSLYRSFNLAKNNFLDTVDFKLRIDVPKNELLEELAQLPEHSLVLLLSYYRDRNGQYYSPNDFLEVIAKVNRPLFTFWAHYMGAGTLGSRIIDSIGQGEKAAHMAIKALTVSDVRKIPIELNSPTIDIFDYQQLIRFGISKKSLSPNTQFINHPPNLGKQLGHHLLNLALLGVIFLLLAVLIYRWKRGKKPLSDINSFYKQCFEKGSDAMYLIDRQGNLVDVNTQGYKALKYERDEIIGKNVSDLDIAFETPNKISDLYNNYAADKIHRWNSHQIQKDGTLLPVDIRISFYSHEDKPYALGVARDMTYQHEEIEKIRSNENRYQNLLKNLPGLVLQFRKKNDESMSFDFISQRASFLFNLSVNSQTPLEDLIALIYSEDRSLFSNSIKYAITHQLEWVFEKRFITSQNATLWFQGALSSLQEETDTIFTIIMLETTEKKKTEKALEQTEKTYQELFNSMQDALLVINLDGTLIDLNQTTCEQFGYLREELIGKSYEQLISAQECKQYLLSLDSSIYTNGDISHRTKGTKKDGSEFDIEISAKKVEIKGIKYVLAIIHNIGEIIKGEKDRKKLETQMFRLQRIEAIGTLAGGIAHDFNNILSPILGYTEMALEELPENSEVKEYLNSVFDAGLRAKDLIKQILTFSRDTGHELKPVKIQPIVKEVIKLSRATIPTTIEIEYQIAEECGLIMADPVQVHQILMNLFTNAYHAMISKGGILKISLKEVQFYPEDIHDNDFQPGTYAELSISDTGVGMDDKVIDHVFDPYFSTKEKDKGTGLGLSVVHGIVKNYGGKISLYSEVGVGTVFKIYLPIISDIEANQTAKVLSEFKTPFHEKVLIVDDEVSIVKMLKSILISLGYQVTTFSNSSDALKELTENYLDYDVVLTDMTMPEVTGLDIARTVKSLSTNLKVILCTGFSDQLQGKNMDDLPIDGLIMKPLIRIDLAKALKNALHP